MIYVTNSSIIAFTILVLAAFLTAIYWIERIHLETISELRTSLDAASAKIGTLMDSDATTVTKSMEYAYELGYRRGYQFGMKSGAQVKE